MAINSQPSVTIQPAYGRTLDFEFEETTGLGDLKNAVVEVINITDSDSVFINYPPSSFVGTTGTWVVDPSKIIQTYFCFTAKPSVFGDINQEHLEANTDVVKEFRLSVRYQYEDAADSNKLKFTATTDITNDYTVLNATREDEEAPSLADYVSVNIDRLFFTRAPRCQFICQDENTFLSYWNTANIDAIAVLVNNPGGPTAHIYDASGPANDTLVTFGAGPAQITAIPIGNWISGGVPVIDASTIDYTIQVGTNGGGFVAVGEVMKYVVQGCCPDVDCRLFWYNRLGGVDAYTFNGTLQIEDDPTSTGYEKPLAIPRVAGDYGKSRFNSRDETLFTATSKKLTDDESEWLRELQTSVRTCKTKPLSKDDTLVNVVVIDDKSIIRNSFLAFMQKTISFKNSNEPIIQQYG